MHRAPSITVEWRDDLHDAGATETLKRLRRRVCVALLRRIERVSNLGFDLGREGFEIFQRRTDPPDRAQLLTVRYTNIRMSVYLSRPGAARFALLLLSQVLETPPGDVSIPTAFPAFLFHSPRGFDGLGSFGHNLTQKAWGEPLSWHSFFG